jgi:hypothetical protein
MKKIFSAIMAVAALAACNKSEVLETPQGAAIAFDNVYVENATKAADLNKDNIQNFGVFGYVEANQTGGKIFNNQLVQKNGSAFTYSPVQYWVGGAQYYFTALVPYTGAAWTYTTSNAQTGTIAFDNASAAANQDLLFAYVKPAVTPSQITSAPNAVAFNFNHMLSRVKFTFINNFAEGSNIELLVTNVHVTDAYKTGTIDVIDGLAANVWTPADKTYDITFGNVGAAKLAENGGKASTEHFYLIPADATYNVTFNIALYQAGVLVDTYARSASVSVNMLRGNSYELKASLTAQNTSDDGELYPIEFTINSVEDWDEFESVDAAVTTTVATAEELAAAVAEGGSVKLTENLTLTGTELRVAAGKEVNVNLNGKTLTVNALDPIKNNGKMTIEGGKIVAANSENTRRCIYNYGEMTINGVEFTQTYDKKGAAINNEGKLTIEDATVNAVFFSIWTSGANSETIINGGTFTTENNVGVRDTWAYTVTAKAGAKTIINGGNFTGNHGVIAADTGSEVIINGGTFHCTATYTGNSDWALYADEDSSIKYDADKCTITSANPNGTIYGNVTSF